MNKEEFAAKVIAAYGGEKKLLSIRDITGKFKFIFTQRGGEELDGTGTEYFKFPNKNCFEFVFPDVVMLNTCDGEKAWQCQDEGNPVEIDVERFIIHGRVRNFPLSLLRDPSGWAYKGTVDIEDLKGVHWIEIKYSEKEKVSLYLDPETLLLARYQGPSRAMGNVKVTSVIKFEDYRKVEGVPFAMHVTFFINVAKFQERWYESVAFNTDLPDKIFEKPA